MKKLVLFLQPNKKGDLTLSGESVVSAFVLEGSTSLVKEEAVVDSLPIDDSLSAEGYLSETAEGSLSETAEGSLDAEGSLSETAEGYLDAEGSITNDEIDAEKFDLPLETHSDVSSNETDSEQKNLFIDARLSEVISTLEKDIKNQSIRTTLVIPDEVVLNCELKVPTKQFKKIQKALPYLIEDQIATDPETCFIAIGERNNNLLKCSVLEYDILSALYTSLYDLSLSPEKILIDAALLLDTVPSIHVVDERAILVNDNKQHFAFDVSLLDVYLDKLKVDEIDEESNSKLKSEQKANDENPEISSMDVDEDQLLNTELNIFFYECDNASDIKQDLNAYKSREGLDYQLVFHHLAKDDFYSQMTRNASDRIAAKSVINLMQGEFKPKRIASNFSLNFNWKPLAILLSVCVVFHMVFVVLESYRYDRAAENVEQEIRGVFKEIFPETKNYSRMDKRVKDLLKNNIAPDKNIFLELFSKWTKALETVNKNKENALQVTQVKYDQSAGELKVDLIAIDFESLNNLKENAEADGMTLQIESTNSEKSGVKGRVKVLLK